MKGVPSFRLTTMKLPWMAVLTLDGVEIATVTIQRAFQMPCAQIVLEQGAASLDAESLGMGVGFATSAAIAFRRRGALFPAQMNVGMQDVVDATGIGPRLMD